MPATVAELRPQGFQAEAPPPLWKVGRPVIVDVVIDYTAMPINDGCCLIHCQTEQAKAWCKANIANLTGLLWGEAVCLTIEECAQVTWAMRADKLKVAELAI